MKLLAPVAAAVAILAAGSAGDAGPPRVIRDEPREPARRCPEVMQGVELVFREVPGGVALELTSPRPRQVAELREQLREAALVLVRHSRRAARQLSASYLEQAWIPPLEISVNDVGSGAHVVIRAQRTRDLPELLELARALEQIWLRSDCNEVIGVRRRAPLPSMRA
jgi:hypothetical protein